MKKQLGRSMIEMLGVLAIIGVLSIGGIALYRRAVNNHQANTILDDVNRFAFAIIEKGNYPLGEDLPKGDFKESGIYTLTAHQAAGANQFSILVKDVPKGVCEVLLDKATVEYKIAVVDAGHDEKEEVVYDTLHKDICSHDMNDIAFYFGDTSNICNIPDDDGPTQCTVNSDCCGGEFCVYVNASDVDMLGKGNGRCETIEYYNPEWATLPDGQRWLHSRKTMNGWTAYSFCAALGLRMTNRAELNCTGAHETSSCANSFVVSELKKAWKDHYGYQNYYWLDDCRGVWKDSSTGELQDSACVVKISNLDGKAIAGATMGSGRRLALCH